MTSPNTHSNKTREAWGQGVSPMFRSQHGFSGHGVVRAMISPAAIASFTNNGSGADRHIEATVSASAGSGTRPPARSAAVPRLGRLFTASMDEGDRASRRRHLLALYVKEPSVSSSRADAEFVAGAAWQRARAGKPTAVQPCPWWFDGGCGSSALVAGSAGMFSAMAAPLGAGGRGE